MSLPKGIIFDMDGVLLDSEPFITKAAVQLFAERGLTVQPEDFEPFRGTGGDRFLGGVAEKYNFILNPERDKKRTYDIYLDLIKDRLQPICGVREFILTQKNTGRKLSIASSADAKKVAGNFAELKLPADIFDAIVTGSDVKRKKPFPDIFLLAAERISLDAKDCLIIEDAPSGVAAAKTAGAKCLGIKSTFSSEQLSKADWVCDDFTCVPTEAVNWSV